MGLLSSPNDVMLRNNLAFSLASLNRPEEAREALSHIKESDLEKRELAVVTATRALVDFRSGNLKAARELYADSIAGFKQVNDARAEIMARFFWTREERTANPNLPDHLLQEILKSAAQLGIKGLHLQQIADKQNERLFYNSHRETATRRGKKYTLKVRSCSVPARDQSHDSCRDRRLFFQVRGIQCCR